MIIACSGKFIITHKIFLGRKKLTTKTIELSKYIDEERKSTFTIADINEVGDLRSINSRLLDHIENEDDLRDVKKLVKILYNIYETDEVEISE